MDEEKEGSGVGAGEMGEVGERIEMLRNSRLNLSGLLIDIFKILARAVCDFYIGGTVRFADEFDLLRWNAPGCV